MRSLAKVVSVEDESNEATLVSIFSSACINCSAVNDCEKSGQKFKAANVNKIQLSPGNFVKIDLPKKIKILRGISSLFIPIILTGVMWFISPLLLKKMNFLTTENARFILCLLVLTVTEITVFILSKADFFPVKPQIKQMI